MGDYTHCRVVRVAPDTSDILYKYAHGGTSITVKAGKVCWRVEGFGRPHVPGFHEYYLTRREARARVKRLKEAWRD